MTTPKITVTPDTITYKNLKLEHTYSVNNKMHTIFLGENNNVKNHIDEKPIIGVATTEAKAWSHAGETLDTLRTEALSKSYVKKAMEQIGD